MAVVNADFAHMFGSDDDCLYLAERTPELAKKLEELKDLSDPVPEGMVDVGWIDEDGMSLSFDDSVDEIKGHQGHGVVKSFMSDSTSSFAGALLESKLSTVLRYLDGEIVKEGTSTTQVRMKAKSSRQARDMCGVVDLFDTSGNKAHYRFVFPHLSLGEREEIAWKTGEIVAYKHTLKVLGDYYVISDDTAWTKSEEATKFLANPTPSGASDSSS